MGEVWRGVPVQQLCLGFLGDPDAYFWSDNFQPNSLAWRSSLFHLVPQMRDTSITRSHPTPHFKAEGWFHSSFSLDLMTTKVSLLALRQYVYTRQKATFSIFSNQVGKQSVSSLKENIPGRIKVLDQIKTNNAFPINRRFSKTTKGGGKKRKYVPRKAAVKLTDNARTFFNRYAMLPL